MGDLATSLGFYAADWVGGDASKGTYNTSVQYVFTHLHFTVADESICWVSSIVSWIVKGCNNYFSCLVGR